LGVFKLILTLAAIIGGSFFIGYKTYFEVQKRRAGKSEILKAQPTVPGPKRYVIYNKNSFMRGPQARSMNVQSFKSMGARNVKQLEYINAASFEADDSNVDQIKAMAIMGDEWVVQEEIEHHILPFSCSRCETIPCPGSPTPQPDPVPTPNPIEADKSWGRARVHARDALALVDTSKVKVCVIDTGIDEKHPNKGNVIGSASFAGLVQDGQGHGTHTAGTAAGGGGVGVSRAQLLICKGLSDSGSGTSSGLAQCLTWCGQQGAQVVSNSWGSPSPDGMINNAVSLLTQKGIYVFFAAGNDSGPVNWPAKLAGSNNLVYAVAASTQQDQIASYSSRGAEIRYISPGSGIISNWPGGGTRSLDGTSMATPHAAGICAFGIAKGIKPCIKTAGAVAGYPFADALATTQ
jgi:subtilisin family serine protease